MKYSNKTILWVLTLMNILNFIDRGIIPGATNEFTEFIEDSGIHHNESVYLGLLQSAFIVGYAISSGIFGHLVHYYPPFKICLIGMVIWCIAVTLSGLSFYSKEYVFLFLARMLSGVAEASFQCSIPPWISKYASPEEKGTWMSIFYTAIPVGTAVGYAYSAALAESIGWQFTFFIEGAVMLFFFPFLIKIMNHFPCEGHRARHSADGKDSRSSLLNANNNISEVPEETEIPSVVDEFRALFSSSVYVLVVAGYAMQTGAVIGVSTFGSAFLMGLGYFDTETESSTIFGIMVSIAGIVATPLGGIILDKLATSYMSDHNNSAYQRAPTSPGVPDSVAKKINQDIFKVNNDTTDSNEDEDDENEIILPHIDMSKERATLHSALVVITLVSIVGGIFLCLDFLIYNKVMFILMIGVGCFFIFMTYAGISMAIMLSVPVHNRAFAMGISTLCIHVFGDVPSPIIAGYIKDRLAPGCAGNSSSGESIATSDACRDDAQGLRLTMLILTSLLVLTVIFFAVGWVEEIRLYRKSLEVDSQTIRLLQSDVFESSDHDEENMISYSNNTNSSNSGNATRKLSASNNSNSVAGTNSMTSGAICQTKSTSSSASSSPMSSDKLPAGQVANLRRPIQGDSTSPARSLLSSALSTERVSDIGFVSNPMTSSLTTSPVKPPSPGPIPLSITTGKGSFSYNYSIDSGNGDSSAAPSAAASVALSDATLSLLDSAIDDGEETQIFASESNPMLSSDGTGASQADDTADKKKKKSKKGKK